MRLDWNDINLLSGRAAGHLGHASGSGRRRPTRLHQRIAALPHRARKLGRIHRTDEPTKPANRVAIEAIDTYAATLFTLDE
jgi:hypothetical protein